MNNQESKNLEQEIFTQVNFPDGRIGFRVFTKSGVKFIHLNPSTPEDGEKFNVFIYVGETGTLEGDHPVCYVDVD